MSTNFDLHVTYGKEQFFSVLKIYFVPSIQPLSDHPQTLLDIPKLSDMISSVCPGVCSQNTSPITEAAHHLGLSSCGGQLIIWVILGLIYASGRLYIYVCVYKYAAMCKTISAPLSQTPWILDGKLWSCCPTLRSSGIKEMRVELEVDRWTGAVFSNMWTLNWSWLG